MHRIAVVTLVALAIAVTSQAGVIGFTSSSAFFAAVGGGITTETYEGIALNTVIPNGTTVNNLTYTGFPRSGGRIDNTFNRIGAQSLAVSGSPNFFLQGEGFTVSFPSLVTAIGIFFNISTSPAGTMGISTAAGTATNGASYDTSSLYFVGLIADSPIGSANFFSNSPGSGYNVDNLSYGTAVPEPSTLAMLLGAFGAMLAVRKRRRQ